MNHIFYTKTSDYKLFGKTIFSKEEIYSETDRDSDYTIIVKPEYFDKEFKINGKDK